MLHQKFKKDYFWEFDPQQDVSQGKVEICCSPDKALYHSLNIFKSSQSHHSELIRARITISISTDMSISCQPFRLHYFILFAIFWSVNKHRMKNQIFKIKCLKLKIRGGGGGGDLTASVYMDVRAVFLGLKSSL